MAVKTKTLVLILWLFVLLFWNLSIWQGFFKPKDSNLLTVAFLDIGQGDSIFIEAPNGTQMLIDGGPTDGGILSALRKVMPFTDRSIDIVMATHPHADHIGGLIQVLDRYKVSKIIDNGESIMNNPVDDEYEKSVLDETSVGATYMEGVQGTRIVLDDKAGVYFDIYYPTASSTSKEVNEQSIVGRLLYGESEFMLTGDTYKTIEEKLIRWCASCLKSDVLKLGHHGSDTSTGKAFIDAVQPQYAIVSAANPNSYGHPDKKVIERLEAAKVKILRTSDKGTIVFESDGKKVQIKNSR